MLTRQGVTSTAAAIGLAMASQPAVAAPAGLGMIVTQAAISGVASAAATTIWGGLLSAKPIVLALVVTASGIALWLAEKKPRDKSNETAPVAAPIVESKPQAFGSVTSQQDSPPAAAKEIESPNHQTVTKPKNASPAADATVSATRTARNRAVIARRYSPLFEELNLSAEKRDQLTQILLDSRNASADFAAASARSGQDLTEDEEFFNASVRVLRKDLADQIREVLGEEGYDKFLQADRKVRQIAVVERLEKQLRRTPDALSEAQITQLKTLVVEYEIDRVTDEVMLQASQYLTPPQVEALREIKAHAELGLQKPPIQEAVRANPPANQGR